MKLRKFSVLFGVVILVFLLTILVVVKLVTRFLWINQSI